MKTDMLPKLIRRYCATQGRDVDDGDTDGPHFPEPHRRPGSTRADQPLVGGASQVRDGDYSQVGSFRLGLRGNRRQTVS